MNYAPLRRRHAGRRDEPAGRLDGGAFRRRLTELPDGIWRENAYIEHERRVGDNYVANQVYAIRCTMTKRGDQIEFDFRLERSGAGAVIRLSDAGEFHYGRCLSISARAWHGFRARLARRQDHLAARDRRPCEWPAGVP